MKNLNICVDIDGTITDPYYWLNISNRYFKKNIKPEQVTVYNIYKVLGVTELQYLEFYEKYKIKIHTEEKVREDAKKVLNILSTYNNIYFITARKKELQAFTRCYLKDHGIKFKELYVLGSHHKVNKAKELNCDIFIEDNPNNAIELSEAGFKVLLLDTNYNRDIKENENILRINHWDEIYNIIKEYSQEDEAI